MLPRLPDAGEAKVASHDDGGSTRDKEYRSPEWSNLPPARLSGAWISLFRRGAPPEIPWMNFIS